MATLNLFKPGDRALHKNNRLDSRPVTRVRGDKIELLIGSTKVWVPAENYIRIERTSEDA